MVQRYEQKRRLQWYKCGAAYNRSKKQGEEWVKSGEELRQLFTHTIISHTTTYTTSVKSEE